tara:strand:- start:105 stop:836 length:732 start_codon:yes stop_codon:yes gene_type:complete
LKTIRIYQPGTYQPGDTLLLSEQQGLHVGVVLRKKTGELLTLFRGDNVEFEAQIESVQKKKVSVSIISSETINRESPLSIHLAQAVSKGERMELVIQKATELGVASITPVITSRTVVKLDERRMEKKMLQWRAIAIAACEQCGRNTLPNIQEPRRFQEFLNELTIEQRFILDPYTSTRFRDRPSLSNQHVALLIGPEGGFSEQEMIDAKSHQFSGVQLGPRILRTETAAISAITLLQALGGDL